MASGAYGIYGGPSLDSGRMPEYGRGGAGGARPNAAHLGAEHSLLRSGGSSSRFLSSTVSVWELILAPWGLGILVLACYLVIGLLGQHAVLVAIPMIALGLSVLFVNFQHRKGDSAEVILGLLCLLSIAISLCVGATGVLRNLLEYHRLSQGASYFNVQPQEPATGHLDAATIVFADGAHVDSTRVFGFTDARQVGSPTYCVAPVADGGTSADRASAARVQYWVAGVDCCQSRSEFVCSDAAISGAHGGVALPKDQQRSAGYLSAVRGAQAAYQLTGGNDFILLQWHVDPVRYRDKLLKHTLMLFGIFAGVYLLLSIMIGAILVPTLAPTPAPADSEKRVS